MATYTLLMPNTLAQSRARLLIDHIDESALFMIRMDMIESYVRPPNTYMRDVISSALMLHPQVIVEMLVMHNMLLTLRGTHPTLDIESHVDHNGNVVSTIPHTDDGWD